MTSSPLLLTSSRALPDETAAALHALAPAEVVVVGGQAAVGPDVAATIAGAGFPVRRIAGATRYDTAALLADEAVAAGMSDTEPWLAGGRSFADALTAGPAAAASRSVLLLVDPQDLDASGEAGTWLRNRAARLRSVSLVGSPVAVTEEVHAQLEALRD